MSSFSPLFSFGVISDIQYADRDNAQNYTKTKWRYYRNTLNLVQEAVESWSSRFRQPSFVLQLGDIIDGYCTRTEEGSDKALEKVLSVFNQLPCPHYPVVGNHELYNFDKSKLLLGPLFEPVMRDNLFAKEHHAYYHFEPHDGFKVIVLDCYEISILGCDEESVEYKEAYASLLRHNPNEDLNAPDGLKGLTRRFVKFNGGISETQLKWLIDVLDETSELKQKAIVCGHIPLCPESNDSLNLLWNFAEVLDVLHKYSDCVHVYLSGHTHETGYSVDKHDIHHITIPGIVETPPGSNDFATVDVFNERIEVHGNGSIGNYVINLE